VEDNSKNEMTREQYIIANLQTQIGGMATTIADLRFTCTAMEQEIKELKEKLGE
jgi:hypothetical protein